jgi:hypothetical protein
VIFAAAVTSQERSRRHSQRHVAGHFRDSLCHYYRDRKYENTLKNFVSTDLEYRVRNTSQQHSIIALMVGCSRADVRLQVRRGLSCNRIPQDLRIEASSSHIGVFQARFKLSCSGRSRSLCCHKYSWTRKVEICPEETSTVIISVILSSDQRHHTTHLR